MPVEDKAEIIKRLGEVYAMTREPIVRAEYLDDTANGEEIVILYDKNDDGAIEAMYHII